VHHIVDPLTGLPADSPWRTVSVAAASCLDAEIAATATMVRGLDWLVPTGLPARLVHTAGDVRTVGGWPA
jgi:thiamine biosynthesis lipoprotein